MTARGPVRRNGRRRGLVLGAGGFLGAAWTLGALSALQGTLDWDLTEVELMLGTSAGSVLVALLRRGHTIEQLCLAQVRGTASAVATQVPDNPALALDVTGEPCWPGLPEFGLGSVPLALRAVRRPRDTPLGAACAALLPRGRRRLRSVGKLVGRASAGASWPVGTWVVAMDYHTGEGVPFGRPGAPRVSLSRAVMASCAVPAWYRPVRIHRVPHVDGAVRSPCNADLLVPLGLDEVYVLAPMASLEPDRPRSALTWLERRWRRMATRRTMAEVSRLRAAGAQVRVLTPNAVDLETMGANMMDSSRRAEVLHTARDSVRRRLESAREPRLDLLPSA